MEMFSRGPRKTMNLAVVQWFGKFHHQWWVADFNHFTFTEPWALLATVAMCWSNKLKAAGLNMINIAGSVHRVQVNHSHLDEHMSSKLTPLTAGRHVWPFPDLNRFLFFWNDGHDLGWFCPAIPRGCLLLTLVFSSPCCKTMQEVCWWSRVASDTSKKALISLS